MARLYIHLKKDRYDLYITTMYKTRTKVVHKNVSQGLKSDLFVTYNDL